MEYQPSSQEILYVAGLPETTDVLHKDRRQMDRFRAARRLFSYYCSAEQIDCYYCQDPEQPMCARADELIAARQETPNEISVDIKI